MAKRNYIVVESDGKWIQWTKNPMTKSGAEKLAKTSRKMHRGTRIKVSIRRKKR